MDKNVREKFLEICKKYLNPLDFDVFINSQPNDLQFDEFAESLMNGYKVSFPKSLVDELNQNFKCNRIYTDKEGNSFYREFKEKNMKNLKMVINFDVNGLNYQNQEEFINDVRNTLSSNKNLNFDLKSENVFDLSSIDTIDKAIAYRKAIVDSYVEKESFLDKFNKFLDANVKPLINNLKEDYNQYAKLQQGDFKNHLNYIQAVIKNTMENGFGNTGNYELKRDFYEAQAKIYGEYKLYKDTAYNERYWDKQYAKNNTAVEKQASEYIKNISANTWDEIEIQVDNSNRKELANIMTSMQQNPKFDYGNKTQFENSYVLDRGEGVIKLRISHNDFKQVYTDMFEKGGFADSKYNNIKLAFLDSNIKNNEIIKNSVNVAQINNMGEKQAIINSEMTNKLVKKDQFEMRRGM